MYSVLNKVLLRHGHTYLFILGCSLTTKAEFEQLQLKPYGLRSSQYSLFGYWQKGYWPLLKNSFGQKRTFHLERKSQEKKVNLAGIQVQGSREVLEKKNLILLPFSSWVS